MANGMTISTAVPATMLDEQIRQARLRAFVGRVPELAAFRAALRADARAFTVLYLHGPGGIGKSTLLQRCADEAHLIHRPVVCVQLGADRDDLAAAAGTGAPGTRPVVLIDELDGQHDPETWLREVVLPAFPLGAVVVVAARLAPAVRWRTEPGWDAMLRTIALGPLAAGEAGALLEKHRVPAPRRADLLALADGNPLALRVAAELVTDDPAMSGEALRLGVAHAIFHRIVGALPTPAHRRALEVSAHALATTEELLRATGPEDDAAALFDWLRRQPFMISDGHGVHPGDLVRTIVETEARWRDAGAFAGLHLRVHEHLFQRLRAAPAEAALPVMANIVFTRRREAGMPDRLRGLHRWAVEEHPYRPADRGRVLSLAEQTEGPEAARLVAYWLDRRPEAFSVYRAPGSTEATAFFCWLRLTGPTEADLAADPVVAAAWSHTQRVRPVRAGEHLGIARFCVDPAAPRPSDALDLMLLRSAATVLRDDAIAWSVGATTEPDQWATMFDSVHAPDRIRVEAGGRAYTLLAQCWGLAPGTEWPEPVEAPAPDAAPAPSWPRADFDLAVRQALRAWRRPDLLADSPLATGRVAERACGPDAVGTVRQILSAALDTLGSDPRQAKLHRALTTTYLRGAPTQEAAAERLGLPFSTYRRHLARGHEAICDLLWKAETEGIDFTDTGHSADM
jgi:DNA-directed RNA polymerase specialized sigma24 family protein